MATTGAVLLVGLILLDIFSPAPSIALWPLFWTIGCAAALINEIAIRRSGGLVQGGNIAWHLIWFYPLTLIAGLALIIFFHFALTAAWGTPN